VQQPPATSNYQPATQQRTANTLDCGDSQIVIAGYTSGISWQADVVGSQVGQDLVGRRAVAVAVAGGCQPAGEPESTTLQHPQLRGQGIKAEGATAAIHS